MSDNEYDAKFKQFSELGGILPYHQTHFLINDLRKSKNVDETKLAVIALVECDISNRKIHSGMIGTAIGIMEPYRDIYKNEIARAISKSIELLPK